MWASANPTRTVIEWRDAIPKVVDRIVWKGPQNAADFRFLKSVTTRTPKITLPGPCYIHYRAGRENISHDVYPDLDAFWAGTWLQAYVEEDALARRRRLHFYLQRSTKPRW